MKIKLVGILVLIQSCGISPAEKTIEYREGPVPIPTPIPTPTPTPNPTGFAQVQKIMTESCGYNGCHSSTSKFIATEAGLRDSAAKTRLLNGSMPPRYSENYYLWEDGTRKQIILDFLNREP